MASLEKKLARAERKLLPPDLNNPRWSKWLKLIPKTVERIARIRATIRKRGRSDSGMIIPIRRRGRNRN